MSDPAPHHQGRGGHHHAPAVVAVEGELAEGMLDIIDTPDGERLRFTATRLATHVRAIVAIDRPGRQAETLTLLSQPGNPTRLISAKAPEEPHEFDARLLLQAEGREEALSFRMVEPVDHVH